MTTSLIIVPTHKLFGLVVSEKAYKVTILI